MKTKRRQRKPRVDWLAAVKMLACRPEAEAEAEAKGEATEQATRLSDGDRPQQQTGKR